MPSAQSAAAPSADRRTAILDAAIAVIARQGVRGLRVEKVAAEAKVAVSLIYYYFGNRTGLVRATLEHSNEQAASTLDDAEGDERSGRELVDAVLLGEFDDDAHTVALSIVWGEIVASAVFEPDLREQLAAATERWTTLVRDTIRVGVADGSIPAGVDAQAAATRLTATVEGLSNRWHAGLLDREAARALLTGAIAAELRG